MRAIAMIVTAMFATPCAVMAVTAFQYLLGEPHGSLGDSSTTESWMVAPAVLLSLAGGGMSLSLPAALLNLVAVEIFARWRMDGWVPSAASGAAVGLLAHLTIWGVLLPGPYIDASTMAAMLVTGLAMGVLYWSIAIRPRRNVRLADVRSKVS